MGGDDEVTLQQRVTDTSGPLHLLIETAGLQTAVPLPLNGHLTIGRASNCDVRLEHSSVSRSHAELRAAGTEIFVRDLGSVNGTRVAGAAVGDTWTPVAPGEVIELGSVLAAVRRLSAAAQLRRVWSHGYFEGRVEEECARSSRAGRAFAILRITIDRGSSPGQLEEIFASALRAPDVLAIYAPGELEVLLVETSVEQAEVVLARLRSRLEQAGARLRTGLAAFPRDATSPAELLAVAHRAVRRVDVAGETTPPPVLGPTSDGGESRGMQRVRSLVARVAPGSISVLLLGETGVGKEITAERIHQASKRAGKTLLRLNCGALSETLLESELFGHEKGSFTGAVATKMGLLETATGGSVFLDEVGELPMSLQVKLLRVLDEKKLLRVGGLAPRPVDVRIISATNRDLDAEVAAGRFREDLFYRLAGVVLVIPPLRERVDEIAGFAERFLHQAALEMGRASAPAISPEALRVLERYVWPGNVRELRNVMERAALLAGDAPIKVEHLPMEKMDASMRPSALAARPAVSPTATPASGVVAPTPATPGGWDEPMGTNPMVLLAESDLLGPPTRGPVRPAAVTLPPPSGPPAAAPALRDDLRELERQRILDVLAACGGNQSAAARQLGMSRGTLIARLEDYGVSRPRKGR